MGNDENDLTPEEIAINALLDDAAKQLDEIDNQIKNLLPDKGPVPELKPPGAPFIKGMTKAEKVAAWKKQREEIIRNSKEKALSLLETSSPDIQKKAGLTVEEWQNPDFKLAGDEKNISQSQDYLLRQREAKNTQKNMEARNIKADPELENGLSDGKETLSMASRFITALGFTKMNEDIDKSLDVEKSREIDLDKE